VFALEIKSKDYFSKGETFLAEISGNIIDDINEEDVGFYKLGHVLLPLNSEIIKINNSWVIYAILPYVEQNYTLRIKNVRFKEDNLIKTNNIEKNFSITNNTASFNVKPGFIVSNKDFTIRLYNNLNYDITVNYDLGGEVLGSFNVPSQSDEDKKISIEGVNSTKVTVLKLTSESTTYDLKSYIIKNITNIQNPNLNSSNNTNISIVEFLSIPKIVFSIDELNATINKNQYFSSIQLFGQINLSNIGKNSTGQINLTLSESLKDYINITPNSLESLNQNKSSVIIFTIKFTKKGNFYGELNANCTDSSDMIKLYFNVGENVTINSSNPPILNNNTKTCQQNGGKKCQTNEICVGKPIPASDTFSCCDGDCKTLSEIDKPEPRNWLVIIILVVVLIAIVAFMFIKYKKPVKSKNSLISKTEEYEKSHETTGKITKL